MCFIHLHSLRLLLFYTHIQTGEAAVQHDVQELNRILFEALEKSLVGTPASSLVSSLYGGTLVDIVKCLTCGTIRRRLDAFKDLTIPVVGQPDLQTVLNSENFKLWAKHQS